MFFIHNICCFKRILHFNNAEDLIFAHDHKNKIIKICCSVSNFK